MLTRRNLFGYLAGLPGLSHFFKGEKSDDMTTSRDLGNGSHLQSYASGLIRTNCPCIYIPQEDGSMFFVPLNGNAEVHVHNGILDDMWDGAAVRFREGLSCNTIIVKDGKTIVNTYDKS